MSESRFAMATRDELWSRGRLLEQRLSYGEAMHTAGGIVATDTPDPALLSACDAAMTELRKCVLPDVRMRLVATATLGGVTQTIIVTQGAHSIVTTPALLLEDMPLLNAGVGADGQAASRRLPILWKHGSAAVLLHEAVGHPLEHERSSTLPPWLIADIPLAPRRATFRDIPLLRMQHVHARAHNAPFTLPGSRIEITLVDAGHYEPLTDVVTLHVGIAHLVDGSHRAPLAPFTFEARRDDIVFLGAIGETLRYPGVICSREGQELVVPAHAPLVLTELA